MASDSAKPDLEAAEVRLVDTSVTHHNVKLKQREAFGSFFGIVIFAAGIGLLALTFKLAYDLFSRPPDKALGLSAKKTLDLAAAGDSAASLILRVLLLLVMAAVGSLIANRGISLYAGARNHHPPV
jgi:hypothetical protein